METLSLCDYFDPPYIDSVDLLPNSLPNLRSLRIACRGGRAFVANLFEAVGTKLSLLMVSDSCATTEAVALLAQHDYPWLPSLRDLSLQWRRHLPGWNASCPQHVVLTLARIPAIKLVVLECPVFDEIVVRLLALAEGGALSKTMDVRLERDHGYYGNGARLLLALWLKREMKKALEGRGDATVWRVSGISDKYYSCEEAMEKCMTTIEEARKCLTAK